MAQEVVWLSQAIDDLSAIAEYIALDSAFYASAIVEEIIASTESLAEFPRIGRIVPEWDVDAVRERIIHSYRVIYQIQVDRVTILAVIHGARLLPDDIKGRSP